MSLTKALYNPAEGQGPPGKPLSMIIIARAKSTCFTESKSKKQFPTWSQNWLPPCNAGAGSGVTAKQTGESWSSALPGTSSHHHPQRSTPTVCCLVPSPQDGCGPPGDQGPAPAWSATPGVLAECWPSGSVSSPHGGHALLHIAPM